MDPKHDNAGVYFPPPLIYAAIFLISIALQSVVPITKSFFETTSALVIGWALVGLNFLIGLPAVIQFIKSKTSIIPTQSASALQTTGIYSRTRNPMYMGFLLLYSGLAFLVGNWWTFILIPLVIMIITNYVIMREEKYLERAFGQSYLDYKKKVRRWI
jgi:protein-S-isoprenylcysteine O-methyltransferase Ste14